MWIKDFIYINKLTLTRSVKALTKNPALLLLGIIYSFVQIGATMVLGRIPIIGGMFLAIIYGMIVSHYFYLLNEVTLGVGKCHIQDVKIAVKMYFFKVYGVMFFFFIAQLVLGVFFGGNVVIFNVVLILAFILLNALPETVYQKHYDTLGSLRYSIDFIKESYIEWFIPNIIFVFIILGLQKLQIGISIFNFIPSGMISLNFSSILFYFIQQIIFMFVMLYRGMLFNILTTTSKHKRNFDRQMRRNG